jgi:hypothetical protein
MNAGLLADGLRRGGASQAQLALHQYWEDVGRLPGYGSLWPMVPPPHALSLGRVRGGDCSLVLVRTLHPPTECPECKGTGYIDRYDPLTEARLPQMSTALAATSVDCQLTPR